MRNGLYAKNVQLWCLVEETEANIWDIAARVNAAQAMLPKTLLNLELETSPSVIECCEPYFGLFFQSTYP